MISVTSIFFWYLLLALAVSANSIVFRDNLIRVPLAKRFNVTARGHIIKSDQARAAALRSRAMGRASGKLTKDEVVGVPVTNRAVFNVVNVDIGTPATTYSLLVDTGSSNTWVGSGKAFVKTGSSVKTSNRVTVKYALGKFSGEEFTDTVSLGRGLTINNQSFGVATQSHGFEDIDGILGLGPAMLTKGTLSPDTLSTIPTVTDNLFSQGMINANEIAIHFEPIIGAQWAVTEGELTFGGSTDSSKFTGPITFAPITSVSPANEFWGINQTIRYGTSTSILSDTAGIVDMGSTLLLIATDAFFAYKKATGAVVDRDTGLLSLTTAQFSDLQSLYFVISGTTFEFTANAQAWPRALNTAIGGTTNNVYLIVGDLGRNAGEGLDFVNGFAWLERFYTVFDTTNRRIGFANTPSTKAMIN